MREIVLDTETTGLDPAAGHRIVYNTTNGALFFDVDGNGATAAVQFATLTGAPALTAADFEII